MSACATALAPQSVRRVHMRRWTWHPAQTCRQIIKKTGFPQRFMATLLGVSQSTVSRVVNDRQPVSSKLHWDIAAINEIVAELAIRLSPAEIRTWLEDQPIDLEGRKCTAGELLKEQNYGGVLLAAQAFRATPAESTPST